MTYGYNSTHPRMRMASCSKEFLIEFYTARRDAAAKMTRSDIQCPTWAKQRHAEKLVEQLNLTLKEIAADQPLTHMEMALKFFRNEWPHAKGLDSWAIRMVFDAKPDAQHLRRN